MPKITFTREKKEIDCEVGANLRDVAIAHDVEVYPGLKKTFNCGGKGLCGECRVHVLRGQDNLSEKTRREKFRVAVSWFKFGHEDEVRLSCQCKVEGDMEVFTQPEFNWFGKAF